MLPLKPLRKNQNISLFKSFSCAFSGLLLCIRTERNMRIHLCVSILLLIMSPFYGFSLFEYGLLAFAIGSVLAAELFNTAIENVVDLISPQFNALAKAAKDVAAGGVLVTAFTAFIIGVGLFFRQEPMVLIIGFFGDNPLLLLPLFIALICAMLFIFRFK